MRPILAALLLVPLAIPMAAGTADLRITEILPNPTDREFIEIHNAGTQPVALQGFTIHDAANNTFTFGNRTLAPGARIVVWGGGADDALGPAWSKASVWNNGGDTATLRDAAGTVLSTMSYGTNPAAPAQGKSLELVNGQWLEGAPTPGSAPGGGTVSATVQDVPPTIQWAAPAHARAGANLSLTFDITDANGDAVAWTLSDGATLAQGTEGSHAVTVTAPAHEQAWTLTIHAEDPAGNTAWSNATVHVRAADLVVDFPHGSVAFPAFAPGAGAVESTAFTLENVSPSVISPRLDMSDLVGPATIPVAGNASIGTTVGNTTAWTPYTGPLTVLPDVMPGQVVEVRFRLDQIPAVLPAGDYGTSFTVVA